MSASYRVPSATCMRAVWAVVTAHPCWSRREMAESIGFSASKFNHVIWYLEQTGYIERRHGRRRALRVIVPFYAPAPGWRLRDEVTP